MTFTVGLRWRNVQWRGCNWLLMPKRSLGVYRDVLLTHIPKLKPEIKRRNTALARLEFWKLPPLRRRVGPEQIKQAFLDLSLFRSTIGPCLFVLSYRKSHLGGDVVTTGQLPVSVSQPWDGNSISWKFTESVMFRYIYFIGYSPIVGIGVDKTFRTRITDRDLLSNVDSCTCPPSTYLF